MASPKKSNRRPAKKAASPATAPRPSFRGIAFVLAVPFIAFAAWVTYVFITSAPAKRETAQSAAPAEIIEQNVSTGDIVDALQRSGVASNRIVNADGELRVESIDSPRLLAQKLSRQLPGATVRARGEVVEIARGDDRRVVVVDPMKIVDSGAGLVEAEEEPQPGEAEPAVPSTPAAPPGAKRIVLILDDVGFANQPLAAAAALDAPISFAIIPNTPNAVAAARMLNERGFELLCHLPMEPIGFPKVAPGSGAILTSMTDDEIAQQTVQNLRSIPHISGVNNHMGSRATEDARVMRRVLSAVREQNYFFVDSRTSPRSVGAKLARELNVRSVSRDVFLDDSTDEAAVRAQLKKLAALAESRGLAVGIGHVYPVTIRVLREEIPKLKARGFEFVPASAAVN